jgi:ectoine hydroxylase-related dioxygenase (phytanoyl-CoA dioxygenase family)
MKTLCTHATLILSSFFLSASETPAQFLKEHGYVWIPNFFTKEQSVQMQQWADEMYLSTQNKDASHLIVVPESANPSIACRIEDMLGCFPEFYQFIQDTITPFMEELNGTPYVLFKDKLNFKWPGGGSFLPHQDFPAYENFAPRFHITAMVSIDPATLENGCLQIASNWQDAFQEDAALNSEDLERGTAVLPYIVGGSSHGSIQPQYVEKIDWLPLTTSPRDLVLFTSFLPHYSESNHSKKARRAMFLTYNKLSEGDYRTDYYKMKRQDPNNPVFHFGTPTNARGKGS